MDMTWVQSVWSIVVLVTFIGIIVWAFSSKRRASFDATARSVIDDDDSNLQARDKENSNG